MATNKVKKSFKKYARKHLADVIETRRKTSKARKEKKERVDRKKQRTEKEARREEEEHVEQLERLKETDPEFYSYLEEEDPTLLQFGNDDMELVNKDVDSDTETEADEEDIEDDQKLGDKGDGEESNPDFSGENDRNEEGESRSTGRITQSELDQLIGGNKIEQCIDIFVSAVRELGYKLKENPRSSSTRKFEDTSLVKKSMLLVAQHVSKNLNTLITGKGAFRSHKTRYLFKRLLCSLTAVMNEGSVDTQLTVGLLHAFTVFVPLLHYVKGITKSVLRFSLSLCTVSEEPVRIAAYMIVRAIATRATGTRSMYQSAAFKGIFLAVIRTGARYNVHNQAIIAFLINCTIDLYGTDMEAAYQHAFVYLRQLAVYLRAALQQQSQGNVRAVVNWQYLLALRTWSSVVSTYSEPSQLGPLIHPVVQIAIGLMDLFSSPRMFPMHLQIIEVLNHISTRANAVYIPVAPYLLRILTSPSVALSNSPNAAASTEPVELQYTIRVKKSQARSNVYHRAVWTEVLYLFTEHLATHSHTIGFPETFWAMSSTLRKLLGEVKVPKIHSQISALLRHIQSTSQRIVTKRDTVTFGPCDLSAVKQFEEELKSQGSPLETYYRSLRQQRVELFAQKQKSLLGEQRVTLESVANSRSKKMKASKRTRSAA
ncbi:unnamed protein product [Phytomonas sp. Hart1]|nr:unnamed protein product [Phytomonas sp. Hart1]|eukprot:CCW69573.1 unnamed protein product [Phytomonas sp. isolate Hart1]